MPSADVILATGVMLAAFGSGYPKAHRLVERDPDIEQRDRDHHRVNQWCCEQIGNTAFAKKARDALIDSLMRQTDVVLEAHSTRLNPVAPLGSTRSSSVWSSRSSRV
jgi:hypothetical protein